MVRETRRMNPTNVVRLNIGMTLNLGDYESLRVEVGVERPGGDYWEEAFELARGDLEAQFEQSVKYFHETAKRLSDRYRRR